jgi:mannose-1-phosphate guanylyltransferase
LLGRQLDLGSRDSIVHTDADHLVVTLGLENMLVVHTPDATLVADRAREEEVKKVVAELESRGWEAFL